MLHISHVCPTGPLREVPDNQEVFSDVDTDQSIIIELLALEDGEPITSEPDDRAAGVWVRGVHEHVLRVFCIYVRCPLEAAR